MRRIVSLKKPMNDREFATGQSAKECGKIICLHVLPKKKHSTPEIPAWSPTAVLIGPKGA